MRAPMTLEQAVAMAQRIDDPIAVRHLFHGRPGDHAASHDSVRARRQRQADRQCGDSSRAVAGDGNTWRTHGARTVSRPHPRDPQTAAAAAAAAVSARPTTTPAVAQEVQNEQAILVQSLGGPAQLAAHQHMAFVDGHSLQRVASLGEVKSGSFFVDTVAKCSTSAEPGGHDVEASAAAVGMLLYTSNVRVSGITLSHFSQIGLRIQGSHVQVDHDTFSYNGQIGLDVNAAADALVENNVMTFNGEDGMLANNASGVIVQNNNFSSNNTGNYSIIASAAGSRSRG